MTVFLISIGLVLAVVGFVGAIVPVIPGPFISFSSLIVLSWAKDWEPFGAVFLVVMCALTVAASVMDSIFPAVGAKKYGASKLGVWGSVLGMIVGMIFFPPWGIFIGAFAGVFAGEILQGVAVGQAIRAGWGVFLGNMAAIGVKMAFTGAVLCLYIYKIVWPG